MSLSFEYGTENFLHVIDRIGGCNEQLLELLHLSVVYSCFAAFGQPEIPRYEKNPCLAAGTWTALFIQLRQQ